VLFLAIKKERLQDIQLLLVALATGGLLGGAFFHLLPETFESFGNVRLASSLIVFGFVIFFVLERFLHWHHNHTLGISGHHIKPFGPINIIADGFHNLLDGILIAASYNHSFEIGLTTTLIVAIHELPQEIGDFGVLIHAGYTRKKALIVNFASACAAFLGAAIVLLFGSSAETVSKAIIPIAAGGFIYLAAADLVPVLHNEKSLRKSFYQFLALLFGISLLFLLSAYME
jgi:zinc and cadmium transporter